MIRILVLLLIPISLSAQSHIPDDLSENNFSIQLPEMTYVDSITQVFLNLNGKSGTGMIDEKRHSDLFINKSRQRYKKAKRAFIKYFPNIINVERKYVLKYYLQIRLIDDDLYWIYQHLQFIRQEDGFSYKKFKALGYVDKIGKEKLFTATDYCKYIMKVSKSEE